MSPLTSKKRSELRAEAHKLSPVVIIGDKGLTDLVMAEIDRSLKAHELIKVRATTDEREARGQWLATICEKLQAHPVQQIGKVFVLFRENPEAREIEPGRPKRAAGQDDDRRRPRAEVVGERGKLRQRSRDLDKKREADERDMIRKGKIKPKAETPAATALRGPSTPPEDAVRGTSRPGSRAPAPRPASAPPRRRPRTSR